jgi:hypothetical protein
MRRNTASPIVALQECALRPSINTFGYLGKVSILVAITIGIWQIVSFEPRLANLFKPEFGNTDSNPIKIKFLGSPDKVYQAEIPMNYLEMYKQVENAQQVQSPVYLWTLYPTFEGYSLVNMGKFNMGYKDDSKRVKFRIDYTNYSLKEDELEASYGQKGVQPLFDFHWKLNHTLSKQQPYGNPIEYVSRRNPKYKDYIYNNGDHAVMINCFGDYLNTPTTLCTARKRWAKTRIIIEYSFKIGLLRDFGDIEVGVDKLINSFNIKEILHD